MDRQPRLKAADGVGAARPQSPPDDALVAAYRDGLELAAVAVIDDSAGLRVAALPRGGAGALSGTVKARWWCRRANEAARVATAAAARLRRWSVDARLPPGPAAAPAQGDMAAALSCAGAAIARAGRQLHVVLLSDDEVLAEAMSVIARLDREIESLRQSGQLKSVNSSYRAYRLAAAARGEKVVCYAQWMRQYRETLLRQLAAALRDI